MQKVTARIVPKPTFDNFEIISNNSTTSNISETTLGIDCNPPTERTRHYHHPARLLTFIAEANAANLTITQHRRATEFFKTPKIRLTCQQNTIFFKGPKLYNNLVNEINGILGKKDTKLERRYLKPFKNLVKKHLLDAQKLGSRENWSQENFKLYNIKFLGLPYLRSPN